MTNANARSVRLLVCSNLRFIKDLRVPQCYASAQTKGNLMALTVLMFFVLIASYALMFGLVKFTENVIAETRYGPASNGAAATTEDTANSL